MNKVVPVAQEVMDPMAEAVKEGVSSLEGLDAVSKIIDIASISVPPISLALKPLAVALGKVVEAAQVVKGNKEEAKMLSERALDAGGKMREVVKVCKDLPIERSESVTREIGHLTTTLNECTQFLGHFAQKGFFSKLLSGKIDAKAFARFDKRIATHSNELGSALDLQNLMMQERIFAKVNAFSALLEHGKPEPSKAAAFVSGLEGDELKSELNAINEKLDDIAKGQTQLIKGQQDLSDGQAQILQKLEQLTSSGTLSNIPTPIVPPSGLWTGRDVNEVDDVASDLQYYLKFEEPQMVQGKPMGRLSGTQVETYYRGPARGSIDYSTGVVHVPPVETDWGMMHTISATIFQRGVGGPWIYEFEWKIPDHTWYGKGAVEFTGDPNTVPPPEDNCCTIS